MNKKILNWMELVRFPNLFTVPGDILLGMAAVNGLMGFQPLTFLYTCLISMLLYGGGMVLNDMLDFNEDLRERPDRVLPSGRISFNQAWQGIIIAFGSALLLSFFISLKMVFVTALIIVAIYLYNGPSRKVPKLGFGVMGSCRSLNIILGATALGEWNKVLLLVALIEGAYIYGVCVIAHNETKALPTPFWCKFPLILIAIAVGVALLSTQFPWQGLLAGLYLLWATFNIVKDLTPQLPVAKIPPQIGRLIRNLIPLQFCLALCLAPHLWYICLGLMLGLPFCAKYAKKFTMS